MKSIAYYYHNPPNLLHTDKDSIPELISYIKWEKEQIDKADVNFWVEKLKEHPLTVDLPYENQANRRSCYQNISQLYQLNSELDERLKTFSQWSGYSVFNILKTVWALLISQYSNQSKVVIAYPFNPRRKVFKNVKGAYVNTLLYDFERKGSLVECLEKENKERSLPHHPYANIVEIMSRLKGAKFSAVISQADLLINGPILDMAPSCTVKICLGAADLYLYFNTKDARLQYCLVALETVFDKVSLAQLNKDFCCLLVQVLQKPLTACTTLSCLGSEGYKKIAHDWNATAKEYSINKTIPQLFEEQVLKTPENIALVFEDKELSYQALNEQSNQLARLIREQYRADTGTELPADTLVVLCLDRSLEMLIGILGVLKAGAAYVPVDPGYPDDRLKYLLDDTRTPLILTQSHLVERMQSITCRQSNHQPVLIALDTGPYQHLEKTNLPSYSRPTDLAYVIYTSGTTGWPKGVMIEHRSFSNRMQCLLERYSITEGSCHLHYSSYSFDASLEELILPLLAGSSVIMAPVGVQNRMDILVELIDKYQINTINFVPSFFRIFIEYIEQNSVLNCKSLQQIMCGGEALDLDVLLRSFEHINATVFNMYGATENTIDTTLMEYHSTFLPLNITIGYPLPNTRVYILDSVGEVVPLGVAGELYVGGVGLARGYLNRPELTAERFVEICSKHINEKLYRTGDLVRYLDNGEIEYLGRLDDQVKLRGYRIEPGEIEQVLSTYAGIKQSVVLAREKKTEQGTNKYLVAYYVSQEPIDVGLLRSHVSQQLPDYMVPSAFVAMAAIPLSLNGKLDRDALPHPDFHADKACYVAPRTELEIQLCAIWQTVLGLDKVDVQDDFFKLGGSSILAVQLALRINNTLKIKIAVSDIFRCRNIINMTSNLMDINTYCSLIKPLHFENNGLPLMYFVHPGTAGCEVYQMLANLLESHYQSIGIDNYNIQHNDKINNLSAIAHYYINKISQTFPFSNEVNLFGWSLGGQIALEMAYQLEKKGFKKINVYLLDTVLDDDYLLDLKSTLDVIDVKNNIKKHMLLQDFHEHYIKQIDAAFEADMSIGSSCISGMLQHTEILLFKAIELPDEFKTGDELKISKYIISINDNNIQAVTHKRIRIERLNCNHGNILQKTEDIIRNLLGVIAFNRS